MNLAHDASLKQSGIAALKVLTIAQEKGGVGKTTVAFHAAHYFGGKSRTLVIDLDQQQSALSEPLAEFASPVAAIALFAEPCIIPPVGNITLASRTRQLEAIEREDPAEMAETFFASLKLCAEHYDTVVIDTPPAFGSRTTAAILAADLVVSPIELSEASIEAVQSVVDMIRDVHKLFNKTMPDLRKKKLLLVSRYSRNSPRQRAMFEHLAHIVGQIVIDGAVVSRDAFAKAMAEKLPVWKMRDGAGRISSSSKEASDEICKVLRELERMMRL